MKAFVMAHLEVKRTILWKEKVRRVIKVAWSFRGKAVVHGTWNEADIYSFKTKRMLRRHGNIAWGVHP